MDPKEIRNAIISLVVLGVGIWSILGMAKSYYAGTDLPGIPEGLAGSLDSIGRVFLYAIGFITLILLILYVYARKAGSSAERRTISPRQPESL